MNRKRIKIFLFTLLFLISTTNVYGARLKDISDIEGVRGNQLFGYGVVVGLNGTGDGNRVEFTTKSLSNLMERSGLRVDPENIRVRNVAAVMVTATLPAFARPGSKIDVQLSSIGDAKSLLGGQLIFTPLRGADGNTYAVAQGSLAVGGFSISAGGDATIQNHPTVGRIAEGAIVERAIPFDLFQTQRIRIVLREADFTTVTRLVDVVNKEFKRPIAVAVDAASVELPLVGKLSKDPIGLLARLEQLEVNRDISAKVIVNEKTGTIVMGNTVTLSQVALAHGNLNISIRSETQVSQPQALAEGETQVITNEDITVGQEEKQLSLIGGNVTLGELIDALNSLGATPRDLISIFNALKQAGALNAELVIM